MFANSKDLEKERDGAQAEIDRLHKITSQAVEVRGALIEGTPSRNLANELVKQLVQDQNVARARRQHLSRFIGQARLDGSEEVKT